MKLKVDYHCNQCNAEQVEVEKDNGSYFCPSCFGMILILCNVYEEDIATREIFVTNKTEWHPVANINSLRKAIKENRLKVKI